MRFSCEISILENTIHSKIYNSLRDICDELNISYQQAADISANRRNKFHESKFKYAPQITIKKISTKL